MPAAAFHLLTVETNRELKRMRVRPDESDVADYILDCHDGDAKAAVQAMQEEIEHLQHQLNIAVAAMGHGFTRGWAPSDDRVIQGCSISDHVSPGKSHNHL
ncbi:hypothetical protein [Agrobacterium larrymoorei]|nr:hypothetical protein [Agrobacterium larrymoorei]